MNTLKNECQEMTDNKIYSEDELNNNMHNLNSKEDNNFLDNDLNLESSINNSEETTLSDSNNEVVNCLSLTVKKDYSLSIVKNIVIKGFKDIWKIAVSFLTLNFLKFFF